MTYEYYTDGAATLLKQNGTYIHGPGGWTWAYVNHNKVVYTNSGGVYPTTNQAMELRAIYEALSHYSEHFWSPSAATTIRIYSDSAYCINICTAWRHQWKRNGWRRKFSKKIAL